MVAIGSTVFDHFLAYLFKLKHPLLLRMFGIHNFDPSCYKKMDLSLSENGWYPQDCRLIMRKLMNHQDLGYPIFRQNSLSRTWRQILLRLSLGSITICMWSICQVYNSGLPYNWVMIWLLHIVAYFLSKVFLLNPLVLMVNPHNFFIQPYYPIFLMGNWIFLDIWDTNLLRIAYLFCCVSWFRTAEASHVQSSSGAGAAKLMLAANTSVGPAVELMNSKVVKAMGAWLSGVTSIYFLYNLFVRLMIAHHCLFKLISMDSKKNNIYINVGKKVILDGTTFRSVIRGWCVNRWSLGGDSRDQRQNVTERRPLRRWPINEL